MIVIGVTGNTGAGKTTVSTIIKNNLNCTIISADNIAKKINVPGSKYYEETIKLCGKEILSKDDTIDRRKLAEILFSNPEIKNNMNLLTAKYVVDEIKRLLKIEKESKKESKKEIVVIDAPLLYECKVDALCNYVISVTCDNKELKIRRICSRDKLTRNQAESRLNAQPNSDFYKSKADFNISNEKDSNYFALVKDVIKVIHKIKKENNLEV